MLQTPGEAARAWGVTTETLRAWHRQGLVTAVRTASGHRRYLVGSEPATCHLRAERIIYARVSSRKQASDLERQVTFLQEAHPGYRVLSDIGSGINFKRPGLLALLELAFSGRLEEVVVSYRDRLARFGFELVQYILIRHGAVVKVLFDQGRQPGSSSELADDLLAIVTVFSARHHGRRRGRAPLHSLPKAPGIPLAEPVALVQQLHGGEQVLLQPGKRSGDPQDG